MKLLITTQVYENYGYRWKPKGGNDYVVKRFKGDATQAVMCLRSQIEEDNDHYRETIIDFRLVDDNYLTEFEQSQLDYEGKITYAARELAW
jgi:hypothetical protein